jgi:hypothetical protein
MLLFACALVAALAFPAAAAAKRGLTTGFGASEQYQSADPSERNAWFDRTVEAGAGYVRLGVLWAAVAPQRPPDPTNPSSYDLSLIDAAVRDATKRGLKVLITVNQAPPWAEGADKPAGFGQGSTSSGLGVWKPNPSDLAAFMQAIATRYSGHFDPDGLGGQPVLPAVQAIEVWNEPNTSDWLAPQFQGKTPVSPDLYRALLNASYTAIKSVAPNILVVASGTDPYGDPPGGPYPPNVQRVRPVTFWERLLCVHPVKSKKGKKGKTTRFARTANCPGNAMFDVFAHHPIDNTGGGPLVSGPTRDDASTPDLGRVVSVLRAAEKAGTVSPGRHPVWVTEFWWDSKPPNPSGAPLLRQARWIEQSLYLFWKAGASVAINFEITDLPGRPKVHAGLQSGVYFPDGRPKPSLTAFQFPFVTQRVNKQKLQAWGKSPEAGKLLIQRQQGSRWVTVKKLQVAKGDVFLTTLRLSGKQLLRAKVGSSTSVTWRQSAAGAKSSSGGSSLPPIAPLALIAGIVALASTAVLRRRHVVRRRQRARRGSRRVQLAE